LESDSPDSTVVVQPPCKR